MSFKRLAHAELGCRMRVSFINIPRLLRLYDLQELAKKSYLLHYYTFIAVPMVRAAGEKD